MQARRRLLTSFHFIICCWLAPWARGQTNLETNAGIQFNFSTPGASHLGRGGAFLALADDATAAYTNPAGLIQIFRPEVSIEGRSWEYTHVFTDRGRLDGVTPTNNPPDTIAGLRAGEARDRVSGLSFLSYVYPKENSSFALYRHELVNFEANFTTQGAYLQATRGRSPLGIPGEENDGRLASLSNQMQLSVVTTSGAMAYRVGKGLSLGLGVSYLDFEIDSLARRYVPSLFESAEFDDPPANFQTQRGSDNTWAARAGFLWRSENEAWSVGGAWRQGAEFQFRAASLKGDGSLLDFDVKPRTARFHVPDSYGLGVAWRISDAFRLSFDWNRVEFSDLTDGFVDIFGLDELYGSEEEPFDPELSRFRVNDGDELRLGLEYTFLTAKPEFSLRLGAWHDPDHSLRFDGRNASFGAVFQARGDDTHYSLGVGLPLEHITFDAAVDYSDRVSTLSVSTVVKF